MKNSIGPLEALTMPQDVARLANEAPKVKKKKKRKRSKPEPKEPF